MRAEQERERAASSIGDALRDGGDREGRVEEGPEAREPRYGRLVMQAMNRWWSRSSAEALVSIAFEYSSSASLYLP